MNRTLQGAVFAVAIAVSTAVAGPAANSASAADDDDVRRTWDAATLSVSYGDVGAFGRLASEATQEGLAKLPPDARIPTILFFHGCAGPMAEETELSWLVNRQGFAWIAPNSFARHHRPNLCASADSGLSDIRMEEIEFAVNQAKRLPWVDENALFLFGQGEGGEYVVQYDGDEVAGRIAGGVVCGRGQGTGTPLLVMSSKNNPELKNLRNKCSGIDSVRLAGAVVWTFGYPRARVALVKFLHENMNLGSSSERFQNLPSDPFAPEVLEEDSDHITLLSAGLSQKVYDEARRRCAKFGKKSYLITRNLFDKTYYFGCE